MPKFSICIPNYNYAKYIGETIDSVLNQTFQDFEICIADNASTDDSWDVIQAYMARDNRIKAVRNKVNYGFAGNLDRVSAIATGDWHIMLSSDDLMEPNALEIYAGLIEAHQNNPRVLFNSGFVQFNSDNPSDQFYVRFKPEVWKGHKVYAQQPLVVEQTCDQLLRNGLLNFVSPFYFVALCYSKELYQEVSGYETTRLINPDRWFHWKICSIAEKTLMVDLGLFKYRWHNTNQFALQNQSGILKYWIDEYRNCFELSPAQLSKAGLAREQVEKAFFRRVIIGYAYSSLSKGEMLKALRISAYGIFTYPKLFFTDYRTLILIPAFMAYPLLWMVSKASKLFRNVAKK